MVIQRLPDGQVNALAAVVKQTAHGQLPEKYGKFVCGARFGFSASRSYESIEQALPDSMLAFVIGDTVFVRRRGESYAVHENSISSKWSPFPGIAATSEVIAIETGRIRRHTVVSESGRLKRHRKLAYSKQGMRP